MPSQDRTRAQTCSHPLRPGFDSRRGQIKSVWRIQNAELLLNSEHGRKRLEKDVKRVEAAGESWRLSSDRSGRPTARSSAAFCRTAGLATELARLDSAFFDMKDHLQERLLFHGLTSETRDSSVRCLHAVACAEAGSGRGGPGCIARRRRRVQPQERRRLTADSHIPIPARRQ